jgi:predicted nucleic acid-binding protein
MDVMTDAIPVGDPLLLDTSAVIAYLNGDEPVSATATLVLDGLVAPGRNPAVLCAVSVAELLVRPIAAGARAAATVRTFLLGFPNLSIRSCDFLVAAEAARIRAVTGSAVADSLIAATATLTSCPWLITNDRVLRDRLARFDWTTRILLLSEIGPAVRAPQ